MLDRVRIVLLQPAGPANVGAAARAIANMGLSQLWLAAPQCGIHDPDARNYASAAQRQLRGARVVATLDDALIGCVASYGATARAGLFRRQHNLTARQAGADIVQRAVQGDVAVVFGTERTGLTNADLLRLDRVVTIPAALDYPALNLAAAVMILCYEIRMAAAEAAEAAGGPLPAGRPAGEEPGGAGVRRGDNTDSANVAAADEHRRRLYAALFDALDRVGYFRGENREHLQFGLRQLFGRLSMTETECGLLFGVARQILWYVEHGANAGAPSEDSERCAENKHA